MQRDFYDLHRHHRRHHHHHQQHHHSAVDSHAQLLYRPEDGHEAFRRAEAVMRPHEAERALRERYLDSSGRGSTFPPSSDFVTPLPPPPLLPHSHRWAGTPTSLMSPESPEDCRTSRRLASPSPMKQSEQKPNDRYHLHHHHHHPDSAGGQLVRRSPSEILTTYSSHYRPGPVYTHTRLHEHHSTSMPLPGPVVHHQLQAHHQHLPSRVHLPPKPVGHYPKSHLLQGQNLASKSTLQSDYNHFDEEFLRQSPSVKSFRSASSWPSSQTTSPGGTLKQRILVRPPDLDLSFVEKDKKPQSQKQVPQRQDERLGTTDRRDRDSPDVNHHLVTRSLYPPQYPAHFAVGSLIQLSNGDLKKVEDLTTDDFVSCAENSNDVGIDHSAVTNLKEVMENGSVKIGFSVGKNKIKVSVEAALEHPFFIIGQGWSSASPQHTMLRYGLPCQQLKVGDVCISLIIKDPQERELEGTPATAGEMLPPPCPPSDRRSSSPTETKNFRKSPNPVQQRHSRHPQSGKQVVFSDEVISHSPPPFVGLSSIKIEDEDDVTLKRTLPDERNPDAETVSKKGKFQARTTKTEFQDVHYEKQIGDM